MTARPGRHSRRRGSVYIAILGVAMLLTVLGLGALMLRRIERRISSRTTDVAEARLYARAAIEMGLLRIKNDPNWRNSPNGVWESNKPIGSGTYTLEGIDPDDGVLNDSDLDPVVLIGTGVRGSAQQKIQVRLVAEVKGLTCLEVSLHASNDVVFSSATVTGNQIISANNGAGASSASIAPAVEAVNSISGGTYDGGITTGITPRAMPDSGTVFDYYIANGTSINIADLPLSGGYRYMDTQVLSPATNPYGSHQTNPQGIYVIDCIGAKLAIQNCRIVGTLVVLNTGACEVYAVNWEPAAANYPAMLVQGTVEFYQTASGMLEEGPPLSFNFNPPGTPYNTVEDTDTSDSYPVGIKGLVYVSGDLTTWQSPALDGAVVVGNTATINTQLDVRYQPTFLNSPPPGFQTAARMGISPGSWRKLVD